MKEKVEAIYEDGKKSLELLLREKAYSQVEERLKEKNINIDDVSEEDIESLVAAKTKDMKNDLLGIGKGVAFATALFLLTGGF